MANLVQSVGVQLNRALEELGARPTKAVKPASKGTGKQDADGLSEASRAHVEEMLKAGMSAVATVVETRISSVENSVVDLSGKNVELEDRVRKIEEFAARQARDLDSLRKSLTDHEKSCAERLTLLEKRQNEQAAILDKIVVPDEGPVGASSSKRQAAPPANANPDVPYEQRTVAKIGNFVYDTPGNEMTSFAASKLAEIGFTADHYKHLHSPHEKGSWLLLTFASPKLLQDARMAFQARSFTHNDRKIWLDAAKTRAELKPARIIHRAFTALSEEEKELDEPKELEKNLRGKQIKLKGGNTVLAYTLNSELKWTNAAKQRYGDEQCDVLQAWIQSE